MVNMIPKLVLPFEIDVEMRVRLRKAKESLIVIIRSMLNKGMNMPKA